MNAFSVKPAVFDLFLAFAIGGYLTAIYFLVQVSWDTLLTSKETESTSPTNKKLTLS